MSLRPVNFVSGNAQGGLRRTISSEAPAPKHRSISLEERAGDCAPPELPREVLRETGLLLVDNAEEGASKPKGRVVPTPFSSADSSD